jgi:type IV pilus assembly protein PilC
MSGRTIGWSELASVCRRMGTALGAGVDVMRVLQREAETGTPAKQERMAEVRQAVARGATLDEGFRAAHGYFPGFFLEMLAVGEQTGKLDHVLPQLASYYDQLVHLRSMFLRGIAWPVIQLLMALAVISLLILVLGWIGGSSGESVDLLGFGLVGPRGLVRLYTALGAIATTLLFVWRFLLRGPAGRAALEFLMRLPGLGPALQTLWMAKLTWSLGVALDSGADARRATRLAITSTASPFYLRHLPELERSVRTGRDLHEAFAATAAFPVDFLDALEVGEQTGRTAETMLKLAEGYRDRAQTTLRGLTLVATAAVWVLVAGTLIVLIFRLAGFYLGMLEEASRI